MNLKFNFFKKNSLSFSQDKKQKTLLIVFVMIIFFIITILYFKFWRSSSVSVNTENQSGDRDIRIEKVIKKIDFDVSFLKTSSFQDLKTYSIWPLEIERKGRQNPFSSY